MAYQTGTATSATDLLDKLRIFLVANGWTQNGDAADGTGRRVHLSKSGVFVNLRSFADEQGVYFGNNGTGGVGHAGIALNSGTAYSGAAAWENQTGVPVTISGANRLTSVMAMNTGAISAYYMFCDATGDNVCLVALRSAGVYAHLFFGVTVTKGNTWTGGAYFGASRQGNNLNNGFSNTTSDGGTLASASCPGASLTNNALGMFLRADVDAFTGLWLSCGLSTTTTQYPGKRMMTPVGTTSADNAVPTDMVSYGQGFNGPSGQLAAQNGLQGRATSLLNSGAVLLPVSVWAERTAGGWSLAGTIPNIFATNAVNHAAGSEYSISTDVYLVFPNFAVKKIP